MYEGFWITSWHENVRFHSFKIFLFLNIASLRFSLFKNESVLQIVRIWNKFGSIFLSWNYREKLLKSDCQIGLTIQWNPSFKGLFESPMNMAFFYYQERTCHIRVIYNKNSVCFSFISFFFHWLLTCARHRTLHWWDSIAVLRIIKI